MKVLVEEGLVERFSGFGTYVAQTQKEITCVGIYYSREFWSNEESFVLRNIHYTLLEKLDHLKRTARIFVDSRPTNEQMEVLPALMEAINNREIQCVIAPITHDAELVALNKLPLPTAFIESETAPTPNRINFDHRGFLRESLRRLSAQGCRSVGLITNIDDNTTQSVVYDFFHRELGFTKMRTRDSWVIRPACMVHEIAEYGYREFQKLRALPEKPDGLIIFPDSVARGVIIAIMEAGIRVPEQMKVVIHRNAKVRLFCPFPAVFGISDERAVADGLIELVERQFRGEKTSPIIVPYTFEDSTMAPGAV